MNSAASEGV